ncbi:hypothetical protein A3850_006590 [Lewinella sp. 4G2]|nr:hypothetical protein A3850_006590 [Lewinella sp. 4G2]
MLKVTLNFVSGFCVCVVFDKKKKEAKKSKRLTLVVCFRQDGKGGKGEQEVAVIDSIRSALVNRTKQFVLLVNYPYFCLQQQKQ